MAITEGAMLSANKPAVMMDAMVFFKGASIKVLIGKGFAYSNNGVPTVSYFLKSKRHGKVDIFFQKK